MTMPDNPAIERHPFEIRVLTDVAKTLTAPLHLPDLLGAAMDRLNASLGPADIGAILLWDETAGELRVEASFGLEPEAIGQLRLGPSESIAGRVFSDDRGLLLATPEELEAVKSNLTASNRAALAKAIGSDATPRSALAAPLKVGDRRYGVLLLETLHSATDFSLDDLPFVQTLADLIALAIDRGRLEEADETIREAKRAERLRSEVMATMSHELRTPLAAIKGYATALMLDEVRWSKSKRRQFLRLIEEDCDNLQAMISDILDSSLIDIGQLTIEPQPLRLPSLLSEVAAEMQRRTRIHRLVVDTAPTFPLIDADTNRIKQVVRNILDNAIKYSPEGGLVVVRATLDVDEVTVSISDQGVGISPKDMVPLFDKYFRAKAPTGYHVAGTGLGLPVARAIVEGHGGRIWAESEVGKGTTLYFTLPRRGLSTAEGE